MINNEVRYRDFIREYAADLAGDETEESIKEYYRPDNDMFRHELDGNEALQGAIGYAGSLKDFAEDVWTEYHRQDSRCSITHAHWVDGSGWSYEEDIDTIAQPVEDAEALGDAYEDFCDSIGDEIREYDNDHNLILTWKKTEHDS